MGHDVCLLFQYCVYHSTIIGNVIFIVMQCFHFKNNLQNTFGVKEFGHYAEKSLEHSLFGIVLRW